MKTSKLKTIFFHIFWWLVCFLAFFFSFLLSWILGNHWYGYIIITIAFILLFYFRHIKKKTGFQHIILWAVTLLLCTCSILFCRPDLSVSFSSNLYNGITKRYVHTIDYFTGQNPVLSSMENYNCELYDPIVWNAPEGYQNETLYLSQCRGYLLTNEQGNHQKVVYQIHGGGYIITYGSNYNNTAVKLSSCYDDSDVFSIDYRVAQQAAFPAALDDALEGYEWLLNQGYDAEDIIIYGESSGGGLALALALKLRDTGMPMPKCMVLGSPWADLAQEGDSYDENRTKDAQFGSDRSEMLGTHALPTFYASDDELYQPYVSPVYGEYHDMPPMLILVGSEEMLLSDSLTVTQKAEAAGVDVELHVYNGMWHVFYTTQKDFPEIEDAWELIRTYMNKM